MSDKIIRTPTKVVTPDGEIKDAIIWESTSYFKTPFNHDTDAESCRTALTCLDPSKAQQHQAEEADINTIVRRFGVTGTLPQIPMPPTLDEFGEIFDFQSAMNTLTAAKVSFGMLPAEVRATFQNNPHAFVAYVDAATEAGDLEQLRKWGLAVPAAPTPSPEPTPAPTPVPTPS